MSLPKSMCLKGHRSFNYVHKNSVNYYGILMNFKLARAKPEILRSHKIFSNINDFKIAISISKKVSKKAVERNKIRRMLHQFLLNNFNRTNNHKPYWLLVNLKPGNFSNYNIELLKEFQQLLNRSGLNK